MQVDQWLDFSDSIVSGAGLEAVCGVVDQFLSLRTYLVGYQLSSADLQVWGQLQGTYSAHPAPNELTTCMSSLASAEQSDTSIPIRLTDVTVLTSHALHHH